MAIQMIPHDRKTLGRVETGSVQFGEDWPGLFVRGDNCMGYAMNVAMLEHALQDNDDIMVLMALRSLKSLFGMPIPPLPENIEEGVKK